MFFSKTGSYFGMSYLWSFESPSTKLRVNGIGIVRRNFPFVLSLSKYENHFTPGDGTRNGPEASGHRPSRFRSSRIRLSLSRVSDS